MRLKKLKFSINPKYIKKHILRWAVILLLLVTLFCIIKVGWENRVISVKTENTLQNIIHSELTRQISLNLMPILAFVEDKNASRDPLAAIETALLKQMPLYYFSERIASGSIEIEDALTKDLLIRQEGSDEDIKNIPESELDYTETALHIEDSMLLAMQQENSFEVDPAEQFAYGMPYTPGSFMIPAYPAYTYDWSETWDFNDLISNFYAIDTTTAVTANRINLDNLLNKDMTLDRSGELPQILIYHTHSQEGFADSIPGDPSTTIMGAGQRLTDILEQEYGFQVLHHTGEYDVESRDYAYSNALPAIEQLLADNPSIQIVIDLHRDGMNDGRKLVMDLQGRPTARFMFFNGLSHSKQSGDIDYLENPYIDDNLALSFQAQVAANEYYPGIARKIYLRAYRYNMHVKAQTLLIELGAQTNTVEEIMNACDPLAHVIATVLNGE